MTAQIKAVAFGEIIQVPDTLGVLDKHFVMHNCGKTPFPAWYCDTCDAKFANLGNLMIHLEDHGEGVHKVVTFCQSHRWFETVDATQLAGFAKAGMVAE